MRLMPRQNVLLLVALAALLSLVGCASQANRSEMTLQATAANKSFTLIETSLNTAFKNGDLPASEHVRLDPYVKAARAGVQQLADDALNPATTPSRWRSVYNATLAALQPLLETATGAKPK